MSDKFLVFSQNENEEDVFIDDVKVRFVNAVKNGQYRLALVNLLEVLNILGDRISELEEKLADTQVDVKSDEPAKQESEPTPRKPRAQKTVNENDAEV